MKEKNQNKIFVIGFVLIALVIIWALARPFIGGIENKEGNSEEKINAEILRAPSITSENLFNELKEKGKIFVFDMRSASDFEKGHIAASENAAAETINGEKLESLEVDKTSNIILANQGEDVYEMAKKTNELIATGFSNTKYLQDGISAWQNQGYPLVSSSISGENANKIKKINVDNLIQSLGAGEDVVQFLDVRSKEDFQKGHIKGALALSLSKLEKNKDKISAVKKVVVYGGSEDEAKKAAITLFDLNFFNAYILDGGLGAWKNAGGNTTNSDQ